MPRIPGHLIAIVLLVVLAACSSDPDGEGTATPEATASAAASDTITVTGVDYAFEGLPTEVAAGTELAFHNDGTEPHEMIVMRKNDDVTESWDELLQMPEEQAMENVSQVGAVFALPGEDSEDTITVTEPGDYLAICFVPVGTTVEDLGSEPPASGEHGPPHFVEGMLAEFTVGDS